jgi:hypothetical protein
LTELTHLSNANLRINQQVCEVGVTLFLNISLQKILRTLVWLTNKERKMITPMRVFVLIFNARTENEGIHTVQEGDRHKILMFESEDDAERFAVLLEAQDFPTATVEAMDAEEIKEFCENAGYDWELVPDGALAIPPEANVEQTDWQTNEQKTDEQKAAELSDSELDSIRRKLEGLL